MKGPHPRLLQPRQIGQIGQLGGRRKAGDEVWQPGPKLRQNHRVRGLGGDEATRHGGKEFGAHLGLDHGEVVSQRGGEPTERVVAVHVEALRRV